MASPYGAGRPLAAFAAAPPPAAVAQSPASRPHRAPKRPLAAGSSFNSGGAMPPAQKPRTEAPPGPTFDSPEPETAHEGGREGSLKPRAQLDHSCFAPLMNVLSERSS